MTDVSRMNRSTRGAARISIVWMIASMVLFFVSLAFAFVATSDLTSERARKVSAIDNETASVARFTAEADVARAQAEAVGWFDAGAANPRINLGALAESQETFKDSFGITDKSPKTLQDLLAPAMTAHKTVTDALGVQRARVKTLEGELDQARRNVSAITQSKDTELASLRQQLKDESEKFQRDQQDAARRLATAQEQATEFHDEKLQAERDSQVAVEALNKDLESANARSAALARTLALPKEMDKLDGEVLRTSSSLPLGWINIGANDRLATGTVFDVLAGSAGEPRLKARCRVTELQPKMARVEFFDVVNEYDPVVSGDTLDNKLFVPGGQRNAVLAGRFSSPSEAELVAMLDRIGITVQKGLQLDTHYLIVGSAVFEDEDGEPLDEPRQPYELNIYREAESKHVSIISIADLRGYFVF
ncbi:MAG: hypothetical protein ACI8TQ_001104 [Planctomycetota bacterium]|jgi:hypothetical protein